MEHLISLYVHVMYVYFSITLYLLSQTNADGFANDSDIPDGYIHRGTCGLHMNMVEFSCMLLLRDL